MNIRIHQNNVPGLLSENQVISDFTSGRREKKKTEI